MLWPHNSELKVRCESTNQHEQQIHTFLIFHFVSYELLKTIMQISRNLNPS